MNLLLNQLYAVDVVSYVSQKAVLQRRSASSRVEMMLNLHHISDICRISSVGVTLHRINSSGNFQWIFFIYQPSLVVIVQLQFTGTEEETFHFLRKQLTSAISGFKDKIKRLTFCHFGLRSSRLLSLS